MHVTAVEPSKSARVVLGLAIVETTTRVVRTLLPEPSLVVGFRYRGSSAMGASGEIGVPAAVVTGFRVTARRMHTSAESGIVIARLRPGAGRAVIGRSIEPLVGRTDALAAWLDGAQVERTRARVAAARSAEERIAIVEQFLGSCAEGAPVDGLVCAAVDAIERARGCVRVRDLADALDVCIDTLEKRFRYATGSTPKRFAKVVRVRRALAGAAAEPTLARAAAAAGYCDESHFVREVKAVTGTTPARFLSRADEAC